MTDPANTTPAMLVRAADIACKGRTPIRLRGQRAGTRRGSGAHALRLLR
jgi:hypothetical protein